MTPYATGDGWTLYHGDCRTVLPTLAPVDLLLTDPPYGVNCDYGTCHDTRAEVRRLIWQVWPLCRRLTKYRVVTPGNGNQSWYGEDSKQHAWCYVVQGQRYWQPILTWKVSLAPVIDFTPARFGSPLDGHPCPKPVDFWRYLLWEATGDTPTRRGKVVLDPFAGSGTTLVVARQLGLHAIGIEQEERFCELIARRMDEQFMDAEIQRAAEAGNNRP